MPTLEEERKANMARNAALLREFELEQLGNATFGEKPQTAAAARPASSKPKPKRAKPTPQVEAQPLRKSRRLQGIKLDPDVQLPDPEPVKPQVKDKAARREGELKLQQLVAEGDWSQTLELLDSFGDQKVNISDFYHTIEPTDQVISDLRHEFDSLELDERDPVITAERIYSITFHPARDKKLVVAGDKSGQIGLWDADKPDYDGMIQFNAHTGSIPRIEFDVQNPQKLYTCSYDGSMRVLDLSSQNSTEIFACGDPSDPIGISDFHLVDNTVYYTTLQGDFSMVDLRTKNRTSGEETALSEKKIGGFSVNPSDANQIATGSLDRTMKLWDIRNLEEPIGTYHSSLSISCTSWNTDNQIVCNGYDNSINIFDTTQIVEEMEPVVRLKHNCKSGKWVSILKSHWQKNPRDGVQKFVIGNMNKFADVFTGSGQQIAHLEGSRTVPAVVALHRDENWVVGGAASGIAYLWARNEVKEEIKEEEEEGDVKQEVKEEQD